VRTAIEPFRIKSVEPIRWTTREERERILARRPSQRLPRSFLEDLDKASMRPLS
jgi:hypothetical protein